MTLPKLSTILFTLILVIIVSLAPIACTSTFWSSRNPTYGVVAPLLAINSALPFFSARINSRFQKLKYKNGLYLFAIVVASLAWISVYLLEYYLRTDLGVTSQLLVLFGTILITVLAIEIRRRQQIIERLQGLSDPEILIMVEKHLYEKGRVNLASDFSDLPLNQLTRVTAQYFTDVREAKGLEYDPKTLTISFTKAPAIRRISDQLSELRSLNARDSTKRTIAYEFASNLGFEETSGGGQFSNSTFEVIVVLPTGLESVLPPKIPIIVFCSNQTISNQQLKDLQQLQNQLDVPNRFSILIATQYAQETRERVNEELGGIGRENVVVIGQQDWVDLVTSKNSIQLELMQSVQKQIDLTFLSPYQEYAPTRLDMFYGRNKEIGRIVETIDNASVVLLGARRIGKTSLLQAAQRILETRNKKLLYLDCYHIDSYKMFFGEIADRWSIDLPNLTASSELGDFVQAVRSLGSQGRPIVFQFDEVDRLLDYDRRNNKESLFRMFRSLAQQKHCQFVFSGERQLLDQIGNPLSAFYNFAVSVQLDLLDLENSNALVETPMRLIGINFHDKLAVLHQIFLETNGHPNLIQYVCGQLVKKLSETKTRIIYVTDVEYWTGRSEFRDRYIATFWAQATPLEKAISLIVSHSDSEISMQQITNSLRMNGFSSSSDQIQRGIRYLQLSHLLTESDGHYKIRPANFSKYVQEQPYEERLQELLAEWKNFGIAS